MPFLALCHIQLCFHSSLVLTIRPKSIFPCPLLSLACPLSIMCQLRHSITLDFFSFSTPINYICIIPFSFKSILSCDPSGVLSYTIVFHIKDMRQISNWFTPSSQLKGNKNPPLSCANSSMLSYNNLSTVRTIIFTFALAVSLCTVYFIIYEINLCKYMPIAQSPTANVCPFISS